ncbi:MAG TPA: CPBP family intramembrane glutamic endopeptidase [Anaerolineaceae bacterium]|nr:CPBP family intramembrane glutamic endopeptidase [Anaerolineaceae bacterium]
MMLNFKGSSPSVQDGGHHHRSLRRYSGRPEQPRLRDEQFTPDKRFELGQLVLSALLFAFTHKIWAFYVIRFVISVVFGGILCGLFLWGKRRLRPVIVAHLLPNIICEPVSSMLIFLAPVGA